METLILLVCAPLVLVGAPVAITGWWLERQDSRPHPKAARNWEQQSDVSWQTAQSTHDEWANLAEESAGSI